MKCGACWKSCEQAYCSNACYATALDERASRPSRMCATCPPGNPASNWLCDTCRDLPENDEWLSVSRKEAAGFECDRFTAGDHKLAERRHTINGRTKYDTDTARKVMKEIGHGAKLADAAQAAGIGLQYAKKISAYWRQEAGLKLKAIAKYPKDED